MHIYKVCAIMLILDERGDIMKIIENISNFFGIDSIYIILTFKNIIYITILNIIEQIGVLLLKNIKNEKREYEFTQKYKLIMRVLKYTSIIFIWGRYIKSILTFISVISAAFTIALRDLIFNFFCGLYIKVTKPFSVEDRIEIDEYKGDVVNINSMNFEILEVKNNDFTGQSTGIIIHLPNSIIFKSPLKNYNKAFKYIWDEIVVKVPIDSDIQKTKSTLYKIVNSNDIVRKIPNKLKKQIDNVSNNYRIYYNQYNPIIYTKVVDDYIELQIRYLVHPKKARFVESTIWNNILLAYKNNEIELHK